MWDIGSLTRDGTHAPYSGSMVFTTGPPGNSHTSSFFKAKGQRQQLAPGPCTVLTISMHPAHTCLINRSVNSPPIIPIGVYLYFPVGKQQATTACEDFKWFEVGPGAPGTYLER